MSSLGEYEHGDYLSSTSDAPIDLAFNASYSPIPSPGALFSADMIPPYFPGMEPTSTNPFATLATSSADYAMGSYPSSPSESDSRSSVHPEKKRNSSKKRLSQGYIPRPQNAFMLFRADFVKQKHVPGSSETNHCSLSKYIAERWHSLTDIEKNFWRAKAKHEKAVHKVLFPQYRFRPIHNKHKKAQKFSLDHAKSSSDSHKVGKEEDGWRREAIVRMLLEGREGKELLRAVEALDGARSSSEMWGLSSDNEHGDVSSSSGPLGSARKNKHISLPFAPRPYMNVEGSRHRRTSSAPQPNFGQLDYPQRRDIKLPTLSPALSRPSSPSIIPSISRFRQRQRIASNEHRAPARSPLAFESLTHSSASLVPPVVDCPQYDGSLPPSINAGMLHASQGLDQWNVGSDRHRRSVSSDPPQARPSSLQNSWTTPAVSHNSFLSTSDFTSFNMDTRNLNAEVRMDANPAPSLPGYADLQALDNFSFDADSYLMDFPDAQEEYREPQCAVAAVEQPNANDDGTIDPAFLMFLPAANNHCTNLTPIDTSQGCSPVPSSCSSFHSTPVVTPSSSFSSPAAVSSTIASSDSNPADLLDLNLMHLDALHPHNDESSGMSYSGDVFCSTEAEGLCGYGFDDDGPIVSAGHLE